MTETEKRMVLKKIDELILLIENHLNRLSQGFTKPIPVIDSLEMYNALESARSIRLTRKETIK